MKLTRRNTVIGLGALAGGAGVISATGAFDAVEANRDFEVEVSGDAAALLGLQVANEAIAGTEEGGANDSQILFFQLNDDEVQESALNDAAVTTFYSVFVIANNGSQDDVGVSIELPTSDDVSGSEDVSGVDFIVPENYAREPTDTDNNTIAVDNSTVRNGNGDANLVNEVVSLNAGQAVVVDLIIDTTEGGYVEPADNNDGNPYGLTIRAESADAQS